MHLDLNKRHFTTMCQLKDKGVASKSRLRTWFVKCESGGVSSPKTFGSLMANIRGISTSCNGSETGEKTKGYFLDHTESFL